MTVLKPILKITDAGTELSDEFGSTRSVTLSFTVGAAVRIDFDLRRGTAGDDSGLAAYPIAELQSSDSFYFALDKDYSGATTPLLLKTDGITLSAVDGKTILSVEIGNTAAAELIAELNTSNGAETSFYAEIGGLDADGAANFAFSFPLTVRKRIYAGGNAPDSVVSNPAYLTAAEVNAKLARTSGGVTALRRTRTVSGGVMVCTPDAAVYKYTATNGASVTLVPPELAENEQFRAELWLTQPEDPVSITLPDAVRWRELKAPDLSDAGEYVLELIRDGAAWIGRLVQDVAHPVAGSRGVFITSGGAVVTSGMVLTSRTVDGSAGMTVYNLGCASALTVSNGGSLTIKSGGVVRDVSIFDTLNVVVSPGGLVSGAIIGSGARIYATGGSADSVVVMGGGLMYLNSGVSASGVVLSGDAYPKWANVIVSSGAVLSGVSGIAVSGGTTPGGMISTYLGGGVIRDAVLDGFQCVINSGGTGGQITVKSPCALIAKSAGVISGAVVSSGGSLTVSSGGTALSVTSNAGAVIAVQSGGYVEYSTEV